MTDFSSKRVAEVEVFTVDFTALLASGETILTANWAITPYTVSTVANPMLVNTPTISGGKISQIIGGGTAGIYYTFIVTITTSLGQTLVLPEHGDGLLQITP